MPEYLHLQPSVRSLADDSLDSRIRRIRTDRWITYTKAEYALSRLEELLTYPKRTRMPNILLVGPTNNGKTMIVEKFRRMHPPVPASQTENGSARVSVLSVEMPAAPDESRFFGAILAELGFPHLLSDRVSKRQEIAVRLMRETGVETLVVDEVHNLLAGSQVQQRRLLNLLRWLGNELQIPLVAVGTAEALRAIQSDDQLANRFEPIGLPPWRKGDEYGQLLNSLEATIPLRMPSYLTHPTLAEHILASAEGILGEIVSCVTRAAVHAINSGTESISPKVLNETGFISPSQRRRIAV